MARLNTITEDGTIHVEDKLLGSDKNGKTFNYKIESLLNFFKIQNQMTDAEIVTAINTELGGTTWQLGGGSGGGGSMSGADIVAAIDFELGSTVWQFDNDTQLTNNEVVTAINTVLGNTNWQIDTNTQLSNTEVVTAINTELGNTNWQTDTDTNTQLTDTEVVTAVNNQLGNTDWQTDTDTQLTNAQVVSAINTELGSTSWQTDTDTNTQLTNAEVVTAVNTELGNTGWQTDTNTQLTDAEVVTAINTQLGNTDWQTDTDTQLTPTEVIAAIDGSIGTGWKREDFATTAQGAKADSAVQTSGGNYSFANVISSTLVTLTISAGSVNWNADGRNLHKIVLTGNCTLENGSNPISGTQYQFIVEQDSTGGYTLAYGSLFKFPGGIAPAIPIAANSKSIITCLFDGTHYLAVSAENFS